eukprot:3938570-Pyramimonas_sp.AAC.1
MPLRAKARESLDIVAAPTWNNSLAIWSCKQLAPWGHACSTRRQMQSQSGSLSAAAPDSRGPP